MQIHEEPSADPAQVRVTAEELAAAVAALEARKAEGLSSTIAIGEAIQELRLDAAPAEIWAEVQARRADKAAGQAAEEVAPIGRIQAASSRIRFQGVWSRRRRRLSAVVVALIGVFVGTEVIGAHIHSYNTPRTSRWPFLTEIPDGLSVYVRQHDVSDLTHGQIPSNTFVNRSKDAYYKWPLIRHDSEVYLRGYTLSRPDDSTTAQRLSLYSADGVGELLGKHADYVTVHLKGTYWVDGRSADGWEEITLTNVQPDAHFHDH